MHISRAGALSLRCCALLLSLCVLTQVVSARPSQDGGGGAARDEVRAQLVAVGERPKEAEAWFRLGIAYNLAGDAGEARKAFQRALKLRSGLVIARVGVAYTYFVEKKYGEAEKEAEKAADQAVHSHDYTAHNVLSIIRIQRQREAAARSLARAEAELAKKPDSAKPHLLKAQALITLSVSEQSIPPDLTFPRDPPSPTPAPDDATRKALREAARAKLREAAASLEKYFALKPGDDDSYLRGQLEALRAHSRDEEDAAGGDRIFVQSQVTSKALILSKPEPGFTEEARNANVEGIVRLRAVLAADGTVKHILVLMPLGHGLSERAVKAARGIKFRPATVEGRPVSQYVILEYNFNVY